MTGKSNKKLGSAKRRASGGSGLTPEGKAPNKNSGVSPPDHVGEEVLTTGPRNLHEQVGGHECGREVAQNPESPKLPDHPGGVPSGNTKNSPEEAGMGAPMVLTGSSQGQTENRPGSPTISEVCDALEGDLFASNDGLPEFEVEREVEIGLEAAPMEEGEAVADKGAPGDGTSYARVAARAKVRGHEVLYIHRGSTERLPISREDFNKLWGKLQKAALEMVLKGESPPANTLWHSWSEGRGLVATEDKETSDYICELVSSLKWRGNSFRAWHRGEIGEGRLVTGHLTGREFRLFTGDQLMKCLMTQNKLKGQHCGLRLTDTDQGRLLRFFADSDLWADLLGRRTSPTSRKVKLRMGFLIVYFNLSRNKGGAPEEERGEAGVEPAVAFSNKPLETPPEASPSKAGTPAQQDNQNV